MPPEKENHYFSEINSILQFVLPRNVEFLHQDINNRGVDGMYFPGDLVEIEKRLEIVVDELKYVIQNSTRAVGNPQQLLKNVFANLLPPLKPMTMKPKAGEQP